MSIVVTHAIRRTLGPIVAGLVAILVLVGVVAVAQPLGTGAQVPGERFADVPANHPFSDAIEWMAERGLTTGSPQADGTVLFRPGDSVTREAFAAFLYRHAGAPRPTQSAGPYFSDVRIDHPFYDAIQWMGTTGLSTGTWQDGAAAFRPADPVTREAAAAFLYRFEGEPSRSGYTWGFNDNPPGHPFHAAVSWMKTARISHGYYEMPTTGDSTHYLNFFRGHQLVERQAIASFFQRLVDWEPYPDCASVTTMPPQECEALVAIWVATERSIHDSSSTNPRDGTDIWNRGPDPCAWAGVACADGHVATLTLSPRAGTIAREIGDLSQLVSLKLVNFGPGATLPAELGRLTQLRDLKITGSNITGAVPLEIGQLTNLKKLTIRDTGLTEPLPETLGQLGQLQELAVISNYDLAGPLPAGLGDLARLRILTVVYNSMLMGPLPALDGTRQLRQLYAHDNALSGPLPDTFEHLDQLLLVDLARNLLNGPIPPSFGDARSLGVLDLSSNSLSGSIPEELGHTNLSFLDLSANELSGTIPASLVPFPHGGLRLRGNGCLTAPDPSAEALLTAYDSRWDDGCSP